LVSVSISHHVLYRRDVFNFLPCAYAVKAHVDVDWRVPLEKVFLLDEQAQQGRA
jgi:redox-sensitive bicupin YhaK (pirin superfamily)